MYILDGRQLVRGRSFTGPDGTQYPANWLTLSSADERAAIGITEEPDDIPYDSRFYSGRDDDNNLIPRSLSDVGPDPVTGITTLGLISQNKEDQNETAFNLLNTTDWYVVRKAETGEAIPVGITSYRTQVRIVCGDRQDMIDAATTAAQVESLIATTGTESITGYTTTFLPRWPELSDYT